MTAVLPLPSAPAPAPASSSSASASSSLSMKGLDASALDSRWLKTFLAVAADGRVSGAAKRLHMSQPTVTAQLQKLEDALGQTLFDRLPRGVELTAAGQTLRGYALRIDALLQEAQSALAPKERARGTLEIAASTTVAATVIPRLLASFGVEEPEIALTVGVGNTREVTEQVRSGEIPLGLVEGLQRAPGLRLRPFLDDELVPCVAPDASVHLRDLRDASELASVPLILREPGSGTRAVVTRALTHAMGARRRRHPRDLVLGSNEAIQGAVELGLGIGFLSRRLIADAHQLGRIRVLSLGELTVPRSFSFAVPAGQVGDLAARLLRHAERTYLD